MNHYGDYAYFWDYVRNSIISDWNDLQDYLRNGFITDYTEYTDIQNDVKNGYHR